MPKYCLKLTSNVTKVNLPKPLEHYKNIKFNMISYVTGSANNRLMRVDVTGFNENIYFDGGNPPKMADTKDTVRHKNLCLTVFLE